MAELCSFKTKIIKLDSDLWGTVIPVPDELAKALIAQGHHRIICVVNNELRFHGALMGDGQGGRHILINKDRIKKLGILLTEDVAISIEADESEFGMPVSEEFWEVLTQNDAAKSYFDQLTRGKQRTLIYWADNVKRSEIKIRRALVMTQHLEANNGAIDFKQLNEEIKAANRLHNRN